jgi:hypothetical protein
MQEPKRPGHKPEAQDIKILPLNDAALHTGFLASKQKAPAGLN